MAAPQNKKMEDVLRHSQKVRTARIWLPMSSFLLLLLLFWVPKFVGGDKLLAGDIAKENQVILASNQPVLLEPRYQGQQNEWAYDISAYVASNVYEETLRVDLVSPQAFVIADTKESFTGKANSGSWFAQQEILELTGNVSLFYSVGYFVETEQAQINVPSQEVRTLGEASGEAEFGKFKAEKARIEENGNMIFLLGKSHVTITPEKKPKDILQSPHLTNSQDKKAIQD